MLYSHLRFLALFALGANKFLQLTTIQKAEPNSPIKTGFSVQLFFHYIKLTPTTRQPHNVRSIYDNP